MVMPIAVGGAAVLGYLVARTKNGKKEIVLVTAEHPLVGLMESIRRNKPIFYAEPMTISLATARTGIESEHIDVVGDFMNVETIDGTEVGIAFNEPQNPYVSLNNLREFTTPFYRIFLKHSAQAGKTVKLNIGRDASFLAKALMPIKVADSGGVEVNPAVKEAFVPLDKANQQSVAELVDTDILTADITPTNTPCLFRVMVMLETAGIFSAMLDDGTATVKLILNGGIALTVDCAYIFDILIHSGDTVNFQTDTAGDVTLRVQEIVAGVQ